MVSKLLLGTILIIFLINLVLALPTCSDSNEIDISDIPCIGLTIPIECAGNITIFNATDQTINENITTAVFVDNIYNFTISLERGGYEFLDCENNTATILIGRFQQGYGVNLLAIIIPSILFSLGLLFISGRMFHSMREEDEEQEEHLHQIGDPESFVPRNRLLPIVFMLFAFIPMLFMVGFVFNHLTEYLPTANITIVYGTLFILFSVIFIGVFLISMVVWLAGFIKMRRVMRGLDEIE